MSAIWARSKHRVEPARGGNGSREGGFVYDNADTMKNVFDKKLYYRRWWKRAGYGKPPANRLITLREYSELIASMANPLSLILEAGCGQGYVLQMLKCKGYRNLLGIDLAKVFMPIESVSFIVADPNHLPLRQNLLDIAFARKFVDTADVKASLMEFKGALKNDGKLVIEVANVKRLASRIYRSLGLVPKYAARYFPHLHQSTFQHLLYESGFTIREIRGDYIDVPLVGNALSRLGHGMVPRALGKIRPNLCLHLMAVCNKKKLHEDSESTSARA